MDEKLNFLFNSLNNNKIYIDKTEFLFQIQSHPSYPSLLSISDTLTFFNVDNIALNISFEEINLIPTHFIALLNEKENILNANELLYFIKKENDNYYIYNENKFESISNEALKNRWQNVVLIIEQQEENSNKHNTIFRKLVYALFLGTSIYYVFALNNSISSKLFLILPILGLILSILALKDLFGAKFVLIDKFCNISGTTSCNSVITSKKWGLFKWLNFSDISITFFVFQIISLLIVLGTKQNDTYFSFMKIILIFSIPFIIASIYFQKFIEKKWCPICLLISSVLVIELFFVFSINTKSSFNISSIWLLALPIAIYFIWIILKKQIENFKELKEFKIKANRFIRNYDLFKNNLLSTSKVNLFDSDLIIGNKEAKVCITLITNPFCGHCEDVHEIIDSILLKNEENLNVKILIKTSLDDQSNVNKEFYRTLYNLYHQKGVKSFRESLNYWYKTKNIENWLEKHKTDNSNSMKVDAVYENINSWGIKNNYNYTPAIFINGYEYPEQYDRENLVYYINDIIEDTTFN